MGRSYHGSLQNLSLLSGAHVEGGMLFIAPVVLVLCCEIGGGGRRLTLMLVSHLVFGVHSERVCSTADVSVTQAKVI